MMMLSRKVILASLAALLVPAVQAQDVQTELAALRKMIEEQSRKLDALTAQVARLTGAAPAEPAAPPAHDETAAAPVARAVTPPAENVHIVVKGDSLEKIAKQHNTTAADLQKLNKITDPKKLQIGQQLQLPSAK